MSVFVMLIAGRWSDASVPIPQGRKQVDRVSLQWSLCCISRLPARASVGDTGQDWKEEARGSHSLYVSALEEPPCFKMQIQEESGALMQLCPGSHDFLLTSCYSSCPRPSIVSNTQSPTLWIKFPLLQTFRMWHTLEISALGR